MAGIPKPLPTAPGFEYDNTAQLADGPVELAKKAYHNATRGYGPAGLASRDGTVAGAVEEVLSIASSGGNPEVTQGYRDAANKAMASYSAPQMSKAEDAPIGPDPGGGGDRTEVDDENARIMREARLWASGSPTVKQAYFQKEGASKAGVGGEALYDEAFVNAPQRRQQAMQEMGVIQEDKARELAAMYDRQIVQDQAAARAMQARRAAEQAEMAKRQEDLAKATRYYTRELHDTGKFWTNPGNVIAAISYSFLPVFSNDPAIGVKLINQAVQQDLDARQKAAEVGLGAARANLEGYRKIAGDREQGDLLARAEAHRMAAQEIQRVGAKYGGLEASKNLQVMLEDQKTRAAAAEMEFFARYVHTPVKKTVPGETAALYKGPGGWAPLGEKAGAASGGPASPVNGEIGGGPSQVANAGFKNPTLAAVARVGGAAGVERALKSPALAEKVSDQDVENVAIMLVRQRAQAKYPNQPGGYQRVLEEESEKIAPVAMELQKSAQTRALIANVRGTMDVIEKTELADGRDPEAFLSWARTAWPQRWVIEYEKFTAKDPRFAANAAEMQAAYREQKAKELRAALQGVFNQHNHELFGGAQTEAGQAGGEIGRGMLEVGNKSSFHQTKKFLDDKSQAMQKQVTELKAGLDPMQRILLRIRTDEGMSDSYLPRKDVPAPKGPNK